MTDRIVKTVLLHAPLTRVWRALADSTEFGAWFGMKFDRPFAPGATMRGVIIPTTVDAEVAKSQEPYEGIPFDIVIDRMEPEKLLSFRWHPGAVEPGIDYSTEPTTLVVFELAETAEGILLTLTESGFDQIPLARRARAFQANDGGWTAQMRLISQYLHNAE